MRLFSPVQMNECWEAAMSNNSDALKSHPLLVEKIKANELSWVEMEKYFLEVEQSKSFIMEFRRFSITPKRMKEIVYKYTPPLLRMTGHEFNKIMDFNLAKDGLQPPFKLQHCLESILKFGNKKVVTLSQLESYLGCEPSYLDYQFSKLFEMLENDSRVRIYKNLIYDYRRARFLENTTSLKETNFKKVTESEHE
ncbi:MAG: hypothetical protein EBR67_10940 [Proteobacteria bacterium]|nr:hypothetical protein [Pseudomonadota bacterium]